jgi:hypothetical protein
MGQAEIAKHGAQKDSVLYTVFMGKKYSKKKTLFFPYTV